MTENEPITPIEHNEEYLRMMNHMVQWSTQLMRQYIGLAGELRPEDEKTNLNSKEFLDWLQQHKTENKPSTGDMLEQRDINVSIELRKWP